MRWEKGKGGGEHGWCGREGRSRQTEGKDYMRNPQASADSGAYRTWQAKIESSPVWDTSCLVELIYDLINKQFLFKKCFKPVTIKYLHPAAAVCTYNRLQCFRLYPL